MKRRTTILFAAISVSVLILVVAGLGCQSVGGEQATGESDKTEPERVSATTDAVEAGTTASGEGSAEVRAGNGSAVAKSGEAEVRAGDGMARAGDVVAGNGEARADDVVAGNGEARAEPEGAGGRGGPGEVRLKVGGETGAEFSGTCAVGGEEREITGQVPGRFVYEPGGRKLECEIRNQGPDAAPLKFSVTARGDNQKQKITVNGDTMSFTHSGNGISYTTSSASGAAVQKSSISSSSYSSSSVSSSSGSR